MQRFRYLMVFVLTFAMLLAYPTYSLAKPQNTDKGTGKNQNLENKNNEKANQKSAAVREETEESQEEIDPQDRNKKAEKNEMKTSVKELRETAKNAYSTEEIEKIQERITEIKTSYPDIKILPIENIVSKNMKMKFDIPPVIKDGRTLIPVRALTEAFGATVNWNSDTKEVTIIKGDGEIILKIDSKIAYVNGQEVAIDAPAEIVNKRTVIPLRFIVESLGLTVDWDEETETIEIIDETEGEIAESEDLLNGESQPEEVLNDEPEEFVEDNSIATD
ncbi:copper amine oxidase N-terminal domain-containing protein [Geosporobacter ferrireducens]|uniref:copper amine oxidase N-terminal domain-containing protein n=1 Tax=Geosporobacter ferrireducens TaxID=1424294 RepID=UPI00139EB232|nr:copper amine oxidase N-terminal domain-containing protein [Geosporobacter ferrireducens]MTI57563.1 copper amine oxidase N-terminal domain-containing protein [Geosporobacter ferrireducens]